MTVRPFETFDDVGMRLVLHGLAVYPLGGDGDNLNRQTANVRNASFTDISVRAVASFALAMLAQG